MVKVVSPEDRAFAMQNAAINQRNIEILRQQQQNLNAESNRRFKNLNELKKMNLTSKELAEALQAQKEKFEYYEGFAKLPTLQEYENTLEEKYEKAKKFVAKGIPWKFIDDNQTKQIAKDLWRSGYYSYTKNYSQYGPYQAKLGSVSSPEPQKKIIIGTPKITPVKQDNLFFKSAVNKAKRWLYE